MDGTLGRDAHILYIVTEGKVVIMYKITLHKSGLLDKRVVYPTTLDTLKEAEIMATELVGREFGGLGVVLVHDKNQVYNVYQLISVCGVVVISEHPQLGANHDGIEH